MSTNLWEAVDLPALSHRVYKDEELVEQFLNLNHYWWGDKDNTLYNKREESRELLLYWLEHNDEPEGHTHFTLVYVLTKFQNDYLRHFRKYLQPLRGTSNG